MEKSRPRELTDDEATDMLDKILEEDQEADENTLNSCSPYEEDVFPTRRVCDCMRTAENSSRFPLRVMEAMRSLQKEEDAFLSTCTIEDIVGYIGANYRDDGDLYAQVRTALKQVCSQGFVMELLENVYHLVGPDAISMNKVTCSSKRDDCLFSSTPKAPPRRRRKEKDDCICEEPTDEEIVSKKRRRKSLPGRTRRRRTRVQDLETGEDRSYEGEDTNEDESETLDDREESFRKAGNMDVARRTHFLNKEHTGLPRSYSPANFFRRRSARIQGRNENRQNGRERVQQITTKYETSGSRDEDDSVVEESLLDRFNDEHRVRRSQSRTKKKNERDEELKQWIKRCQAECVRQGKQPKNN